MMDSERLYFLTREAECRNVLAEYAAHMKEAETETQLLFYYNRACTELNAAYHACRYIVLSGEKGSIL